MGTFSNRFGPLEGLWYEGLFSSRYLCPICTIPVEFGGSMVLLAFCAAVWKLSTRHRMVLCWITIFLCYYRQAVYIIYFFRGMFIADVSLGRNPHWLKSDTQLLAHEDKAVPPPRK